MVSELLLHVWNLSHFGAELASRDNKAIIIFWRVRAWGRTGCSLCSGHLEAASLYRRQIPFISCLGSPVWLLEDAVQMDCVQRISLRYQHCCLHVPFMSPWERERLPLPCLADSCLPGGGLQLWKGIKRAGNFNLDRLSERLFKLTEIAAFLMLLHVTVWPLSGHVMTHLSHCYPGVHLFLCRIHLLCLDLCFNFKLWRTAAFYEVVFSAGHSGGQILDKDLWAFSRQILVNNDHYKE